MLVFCLLLYLLNIKLVNLQQLANVYLCKILDYFALLIIKNICDL